MVLRGLSCHGAEIASCTKGSWARSTAGFPWHAKPWRPDLDLQSKLRVRELSLIAGQSVCMLGGRRPSLIDLSVPLPPVLAPEVGALEPGGRTQSPEFPSQVGATQDGEREGCRDSEACGEVHTGAAGEVQQSSSQQAVSMAWLGLPS